MKRRAKGRSENSEPFARWEASGPPGWIWEAYETEEDDLFFGRMKSPETDQQWRWGHFTRGELEQAGATRVRSDEDDQSDPRSKPGEPCEAKLYEVELEAIY